LAEFRKGQELALKFTESDEYLEVSFCKAIKAVYCQMNFIIVLALEVK